MGIQGGALSDDRQPKREAKLEWKTFASFLALIAAAAVILYLVLQLFLFRLPIGLSWWIWGFVGLHILFFLFIISILLGIPLSLLLVFGKKRTLQQQEMAIGQRIGVAWMALPILILGPTVFVAA